MTDPRSDAADVTWQRISAAFDAAVKQPALEREAWLAANYPNPELRREVLGLLAAHDRQGVLDRPVLAAPVDSLARALAASYLIEGELGRGGMGTVYLARERKHQRLVVLKVLKPEVASALGPHRFLTEVRIAAALSHPHIVAFIDSGEADGFLYYVMPYMGGETLRERLRREGSIEPRRALALLSELAAALAYAHGEGVIHRDFKPENILCVDDHVYLLDFGIAKLFAGHDATEGWTGTGVAIGTAGYMAPEQALGKPVDYRADIYAWGVVAREMLGGSAAGLETIIASTLEPDPADRPANAADLVRSLEALKAGSHAAEPPGRRAAGPLSRHRRIATTTAVIAGVAFLAWSGFRARAGIRESEATAAQKLAMPVAVAPLRNETGDSTLTTWGRLAGDWITQGLHETGVVAVVPWPYALQASLRDEVRAGTVVTGAYYLVGDMVRFQTEIIDAASGLLLAAPPPIEVARDSIDHGVALLRERVMGALALRSDERLASVPGLLQRPPTFQAYRAFGRGLELHLTQEYARAAVEFHAAFLLDTAFVVPLVYAALAHWNSDEFARADSTLTEVRLRRAALNEYHDLLSRSLAALLAGDRARALAVMRRAVEIAPGSRAPYNVAVNALTLNQPEAALAALATLDPDHGPIRGWAAYWTQLAHAHHLLGAHNPELAAARERARRHPGDRVAIVLEVRALAAMGRTVSIDSVLREAIAQPPDTYWSQGAAMVIAAEELAAHGRAGADRYRARAVTWLANHLAREPAHEAHRYWMGSALYSGERWNDAAPYFESLVTDYPENVEYRGRAAMLAARRGSLHPELVLGDAPSHDRGRHTVFRARLAAIDGDTAAAAALLSEAVRQGVENLPWLHATAHLDLAALRGHPIHDQLMGGHSSQSTLRNRGPD